MLVWAAGCLFAGWWQATRAMDGNALSYLYAVEWPVFALGGIVVWWLMLHTAPVTAEEREQRREHEAAKRFEAQAAKRRPEDEDEALKAYNDHLAALAESDRQLRRDV
jgi:hypothetical protein